MVTNTGERAVEITSATFVTDSGQQVGLGPYEPDKIERNKLTPGDPYGSLLPLRLIDGESVSVHWKMDSLEWYEEHNDCGKYLYLYVLDSVGNRYYCPYLGVKAKRAGFLWRKRKYVPRADWVDTRGATGATAVPM